MHTYKQTGETYPLPSNPTLTTQLSECLKWSDEAYGVSQNIFGSLFSHSNCVESEKCPPNPNGIEGMASKLSTDLACLVGYLRTIEGKL